MVTKLDIIYYLITGIALSVLGILMIFGIAKLNIVSRTLEEKIGDNVVWLGVIVLVLGLIILGLFMTYFILIVKKLKLGKVGLI